MTIVEAEQLVAMLAATYPHTMISGETVAMYALALADCDADEGAGIVLQWISNERRWPAIAELRRAIAAKRGECAPDFVAAWREVRSSFSLPEHRRVPWSHPAIADAVESLGLREIGQSAEPEIVRAQFERYYKAACDRYTPKSSEMFRERLAEHIKQRSRLNDGKPRRLFGPTEKS